MRKTRAGPRSARFAAVMLAAPACTQLDGLTARINSKRAADETVMVYQIDVDTREKVVPSR